jgi:hypothetical protein
MKMVLASNNSGKLAELQTMFGTLKVQLVRQSELNISEAAEPYKTFVKTPWPKQGMLLNKVDCPPWPTTPVCALTRLVVCLGWTQPTIAHSLGMKNQMPTT